MRQDASVSNFAAQALRGLSVSMGNPGSPGAEFGRSHPTYNAARVNIGFGAAPGRQVPVHPAISFAFNNPGVRFGNRSTESSRPLSKDGASSFHFSHSFASKTSPLKQLIREFHGGRTHSASLAAAHLLYIERDGAAEKLQKNPSPKSREALIEALQAAAMARNPEDQQTYIERSGAPEIQNLLTSTDEVGASQLASFGNIGDTLEDRLHFWNAVEKIEREPRGDAILAKFSEYPDQWHSAKAAIKFAPKLIQSRLKASFGVAPGDINFRDLATPRALDIYKWLHEHAPDVPSEINPGRGGRVQNRIIAELPHELTARERLNILTNFTQKLTEKNLPFWAVIHAPDSNNDKRNYHVHIVYYDRPCKRVTMETPRGKRHMWDFEFVETKTFPNRHTRQTRPLMQEKDREVNSRGWIYTLRGHWEEACNAGLAQAGASKRYDRRTYKEMGIDLDPLKHIPSKTFNKERKGEVTVEGIDLARRQWNVLLETLANQNATLTYVRLANLEKKVNAAKKALLENKTLRDKAAALSQAEKLGSYASAHARAVGLTELLQDVTRLLIDRVASRAKLIFYGSYDAQTKRKRGRPRKNAPPVSPDTLSPEAREAAQFLKTLIARGKELDRHNGREVVIAQGQLAVVMRRLERLTAPPQPQNKSSRNAAWDDTMDQQHKRRLDELSNRIYTRLETIMPPQPKAPSRAKKPAPVASPAARTARPNKPAARAPAPTAVKPQQTVATPKHAAGKEQQSAPESRAAITPRENAGPPSIRPTPKPIRRRAPTPASTAPSGSPPTQRTIPADASKPATRGSAPVRTRKAPIPPPAGEKPLPQRPAPTAASTAPEASSGKGPPGTTPHNTTAPSPNPAATRAGAQERPLIDLQKASVTFGHEQTTRTSPHATTKVAAPLPVKTIKTKEKSATERTRESVTGDKPKTPAAEKPADAHTPDQAPIPEGQPLPVKKLVRKKPRRRDSGYER